MGGLFSSPKPPPPPPTPEVDRRSAALEEQERRERKSLRARRKARTQSARALMTQVRTSPVTGEGSNYGQATTLGPDVRNPR
tara:strand:- start:7485 stop:7730 length:246 start_codon:yes stop_codon:yes gene_type:complete